MPDLFRSRERYEFLNVVLDRRIRHARHAVSLDEMRGPFRPTLWEEPPADKRQDIKQVWFPGDHCDVGGGHVDARLSEDALRWMIDEAEAAVGLPFQKAGRTAIAPDAVAGTLHGMEHGPWGAVVEAAFQPRPRATPVVDPARRLPNVVDASAYRRQQATRNDPQPYRPSRILQPGQEMDVDIEATKGWNVTGIYCERGRYRFTADGQWRTPFGGSSGPQGITPWPVVGDAFGNVVNLVERGLRFGLANPEAELAGARREATQPLMILVGLIANEVTDARGRIADRNGQNQKLIIGAGGEADVERPGYLWAYANDAWGTYGNNTGRVTLTVTRLR